MKNPQIEVRLYRGEYSQPYALAIPMSQHMIKDLCEPLEWSDEPISLMLKSFPEGKDYVQYRRRAVKLRESTAKEIAHEITKALLKAFGERDEMDGYRINER